MPNGSYRYSLVVGDASFPSQANLQMYTRGDDPADAVTVAEKLDIPCGTVKTLSGVVDVRFNYIQVRYQQ